MPQDSRAILRQKTLLGETYVELTPGTKAAPKIPEGGRLETAQVAPTVELDEIFRAFDKKTREGFQVWQQDLGKGIEGTDRTSPTPSAGCPTFAENTNEVLEDPELAGAGHPRGDQEHGRRVRRAHRARRPARRAGSATPTTCCARPASRDDSIRALFRAFPTFIDESHADPARSGRLRREHRAGAARS